MAKIPMGNYISSLHIPALLRDFDAESFKAANDHEWCRLQVFVDYIPKYLKEGKSVIFQFESALTNSRLAVYLLQEIINQDFLDVDYITAEQVVVSFKNTWNTSTTVDFDRDYSRLLSRDFLVIDSIVAEYLDSYGVKIFSKFLESRLLSRKSTVITRGNVKFNDRLLEIMKYTMTGIPNVQG
jgi:DNA replication protein DnaC